MGASELAVAAKGDGDGHVAMKRNDIGFFSVEIGSVDRFQSN